MIIGAYDPENAIWTMPGGTSPRQLKGLFDSRAMKCAKGDPAWWPILRALYNIKHKRLMAHVSAFVKDGKFCAGERVIIKITSLPPAFSDRLPLVVNTEKIDADYIQYNSTVECLWEMNLVVHEAIILGGWNERIRKGLRESLDKRIKIRDKANDEIRILS